MKCPHCESQQFKVHQKNGHALSTIKDRPDRELPCGRGQRALYGPSLQRPEEYRAASAPTRWKALQAPHAIEAPQSAPELHPSG
jgi:hypothetical protein